MKIQRTHTLTHMKKFYARISTRQRKSPIVSLELLKVYYLEQIKTYIIN